MSVKHSEFDIKTISGLSKLSCSENIKQRDIEEIINYFNIIKDVEYTPDKANINTASSCGLREDVSKTLYSRDDMLRNASNRTDEYICVPKTFE